MIFLPDLPFLIASPVREALQQLIVPLFLATGVITSAEVIAVCAALLIALLLLLELVLSTGRWDEGWLREGLSCDHPSLPSWVLPALACFRMGLLLLLSYAGASVLILRHMA